MRQAAAVRPAVLLLEPRLEVPGWVCDLDAFRRWTRAGTFPQRGRIDWIGSCIELDVSPEDVNTHSSLKSALAHRLMTEIEDTERGQVYIDRTRYVSPAGALSCEPDVLVVTDAAQRAGRVRYILRADEADGRYLEIEGAADLVVECASDSSETKDRVRLLDAYLRAGVGEYWLADGRGDEPSLRVLVHAGAAWDEAQPREDGALCSPLLAGYVRLTRRPQRPGQLGTRFRLDVTD